MAKKKLKKSKNKIKIKVFFQGTKKTTEVKKLLALAPLLLDELTEYIPPSVSELSLTFCSDDYIQGINAAFRKKNAPTDVLSFPLLTETDTICPSLGDLIISLPTAKRQAKDYKVSYLYELKKLLIHGVLHLVGFDHEKVTQKERMRMKRMEKKLISLFSNPH